MSHPNTYTLLALLVSLPVMLFARPQGETAQPAGTEQAPRAVVAGQGAAGVDSAEVRVTRLLMENWQFRLEGERAGGRDSEAPGGGWQAVSLPHTWNAQDAASLDARDYHRGVGWYRLEFDTPQAGGRHWLEFGVASLVADVWLNGEKLGQHKGGFTAFRFDVTDRLADRGRNELLVKVDNSAPEEPDDLTAIAPLGGDFNISGGLYRHVALISTPGPAHFALDDLGGPGVYARTMSVSGGTATVRVEAVLSSEAGQAGAYMMRLSLADDGGAAAASVQRPVRLPAGGRQEVTAALQVPNARLWQGREDPYLYSLVAELLDGEGSVVDKVVQAFGIRQMRFDPATGFHLNDRPMRLRGVAMHQDFLGKGFAVSTADIDRSLDLIMEIGANFVRFGHYPFPQYALQRADELGLIVWAETALGLGTSTERCSTTDPTAVFVENARQQLEEMIRQQFNHAAVATWSVGNETSARQLNCENAYDNVRPVLRELHALARRLDPGRPTVYAEFGHPVERSGPFATEGITDLFATNRYFLWYTADFSRLGPLLDGLHALTPDQPLGISEYGAGASIAHHTDNPQGGLPDIRSAPEGEVAWQPEEYAAWAHEQNYRLFESKPYLWGTVVWNMFDFGSAHRNEGGLQGVNTKGLVTFDRQTRKDAFYFYKANWSEEPVTHIVGRRYTDRAYPVTEVKVYSNADSVRLMVNGREAGTMSADPAGFHTFVFEDVELAQGANSVEAVGSHAGQPVRDQVAWTLQSEDFHIAAGRVTTGYTAPDGSRLGSDAFFSGGTFGQVGAVEREPSPDDIEGGYLGVGIERTADPALYEYYRTGTFRYQIPLDNGRYEVTLRFIEPDEEMEAGGRVFDVRANGRVALDDFDVLREAGAPLRVVTRSFDVEVAAGLLRLDFTPSQGEAIVSAITISPRPAQVGRR